MPAQTPDLQVIATKLVQELGPTLVAVACGSRDRKAPVRWAEGTEPVPQESVERLLFLNDIFTRISDHDSADIARAWLVGCNPGLNEEQPVIAIREGRLREVDTMFVRHINDIYN